MTSPCADGARPVLRTPSGSASSAPVAWAPCSPPPCARPATAWWVSAPALTRAGPGPRSCCPGVPVLSRTRSRGRAPGRPGAARRRARRPRRPGARPRRVAGRCTPPGRDPHIGTPRLDRPRCGGPRRGDHPGRPPGADVRWHRGRSPPAARGCLWRHGSRPALAGRRVAGCASSAEPPSPCRRSCARSGTPASPTAPITWSPSSRRRSTSCGRRVPATPPAVLRPLLSAALERTLEQGDAALTGPVARGDADAVAGHLQALEEHATGQAPLYRGLARATAGRLDDPAPELLAGTRRPPALTRLSGSSATAGQAVRMSVIDTRMTVLSTAGRQPVTQTRCARSRSPRPASELAAARAELRGPGRRRHDDGGAARRSRRADPQAAAVRQRDRDDLRQPAAVRRRRGPRPLPAHARRRPRGVRWGRAPTWCSLRPPTSCTPRARRWCGSTPAPAVRCWKAPAAPGTSIGVLTVVSKLLNLTRPDRAYFGEKDFQQLTLIRRMVADLDMPVEIVGVPTGATLTVSRMSSRNRYLAADQRPTALTLSRALAAGAAAAPLGREAVLASRRRQLAGRARPHPRPARPRRPDHPRRCHLRRRRACWSRRSWPASPARSDSSTTPLSLSGMA